MVVKRLHSMCWDDTQTKANLLPHHMQLLLLIGVGHLLQML